LTRPLLVAASFAVACALPCGSAEAFPHVVKRGETLARIAERIYGRVEMEQLLVAANALDLEGGVPIVPGMRLEIPAIEHHRVASAETWASLAAEFLGDEERSDVLALANDSMPWLPPAIGQEIRIPYNLRVIARDGDSTLTYAYRFLGERDKAWMLDRYNRLKGRKLERGDVVLVPLHDLPLTPLGKDEAASAGALVRSEGAGRAREAQRRADAELPQLVSDVRGGRYVDAIARGNRLLGLGDLSKPQLAAIHRQLTEAYVALDSVGLAETSCAAWREADPAIIFDPIELSPKILRVCAGALANPSRPPADAPAAVPDGGAARP
jgi:plasmid stability protein